MFITIMCVCLCVCVCVNEADVETKVALLDPKHIVVRTILTYDEDDLLSYPFVGQFSRNHEVADPSSFVKLSWHDEIYHLV